MHKIVLAFDSYKGSVSASEISESLTQTIVENWPQCEVCSFPIADGGEGTLEAVGRCIPLKKYSCEVHNPLMEWMEASYGVTKEGVAVIEMAEASGLPLVPMELRNPMETTSLGTGELIKDALDKGFRKFIIGLGGSATNDAGTGIMKALGVRFLDSEGNELEPVGKNLQRIAQIDQTLLCPEVHESEFTLACDVTNPFYGVMGAAKVFAPQKGATHEQVLVLDDGMKAFAKILEQETGNNIVDIPGAGAAGGVGGGLMALLHATPKSGIDVILELKHFNEVLIHTDVVLTGEGKIDEQTGMGKALHGVLKHALRIGVPVVGIGGSVEQVKHLNNMGFTAVFSIQQSPISLERAMDKDITLNHLNDTVLQILRLIDTVQR